jgi:hypothetical protein
MLVTASQGGWCDEKILSKVREMAVPEMERDGPNEAWMIGGRSVCPLKSLSRPRQTLPG